MVKNNLLTDIGDRVLYLSGTYEGRVHDKKICDEENVRYKKGVKLWKDTGYEGHNPEGVITKQPIKKKKGKELTKEEKEYNLGISKVRVWVEHVMGRVKIFRIIKEVIRNTIIGFNDTVMDLLWFT